MKKSVTETINISGIDYVVKRSARRTVALRVTDNGVCEILAPYGVSQNRLREIALPYTDKIKDQSLKIRQRNIKRNAFRLSYGDSIRYLGNKIEIRAGENKKPYLDGGILHLPKNLDEYAIKASVLDAYRMLAKGYIPGRVTVISEAMGLFPKSVKINSAVSHWGSCSKANTLNFSWLSIMARADALDYIIVHELCHMKCFNHSKAFWEEVSRGCPDYKRHKAYLKELWQEIIEENWF